LKTIWTCRVHCEVLVYRVRKRITGSAAEILTLRGVGYLLIVSFRQACVNRLIAMLRRGVRSIGAPGHPKGGRKFRVLRAALANRRRRRPQRSPKRASTPLSGLELCGEGIQFAPARAGCDLRRLNH
jgi:hypothetical protein